MFESSKISPAKLQLALAILSPNYDYLARYIDDVADGEAWKDEQSGALLVGPNPGKGTHAFDITLFPPTTAIGSDEILGYSRRPIPAKLREFLSCSNGCELGELSIFGVVSEFTRSVRAPLDIGMGELWRTGYAPCDTGFTLFGSRNTSSSGQIGYFISEDGTVLGRGNGEQDASAESGSWPSFDLWLTDQLF